MNVFLKASQLTLLAGWMGLGLSGCDALIETEAPTQQGQNRPVSIKAPATEQPVAIFHAFHQRFSDGKQYVCAVAQQGYSHI